MLCCTKSLNTQEERLATSPESVTMLHLPHAIVVWLHVHKADDVILKLEMASTVDVCAVAYPCR